MEALYLPPLFVRRFLGAATIIWKYNVSFYGVSFAKLNIFMLQ